LKNPHRRIFRSGSVRGEVCAKRDDPAFQPWQSVPLEHLRNSRSSSRSYTNAMKRKFLGTAVLALVLVTVSFAQSAPAAGSAATAPASTAAANGGVRVGIIDIQQAIVATNEGTRDFEALQKKFEPKKNELAGLNTEVENLKKQLNTQGDKMNEEARATLVKSIETKQKSLQRQVEDAQNEYQQQQNEIATRILQKMSPVIDKYAKANGYGLLIDSSNPWPQGPVLWATAAVDLTKNIVDAYNAQSGVAPPATTPKPAGAPGATTGKPVGTATPPAGATKPASTASNTAKQ
jgi:outer membrane protein